jgi:hypothetical protein
MILTHCCSVIHAKWQMSVRCPKYGIFSIMFPFTIVESVFLRSRFTFMFTTNFAFAEQIVWKTFDYINNLFQNMVWDTLHSWPNSIIWQIAWLKWNQSFKGTHNVSCTRKYFCCCLLSFSFCNALCNHIWGFNVRIIFLVLRTQKCQVCLQFLLRSGHAMAQALGPLPVTSWVWSRVTPSRICVRSSSPGTGFFCVLRFSPVIVIPPMLHTHLFVYHREVDIFLQ